MTDIILCGVGGQGTVLASRLIAAAAMSKGMDVMSAETIGMAQKGGSVFSHLRIGKGMHTPMIARGTADIIIAFEPAEAVRMLSYLKKGGKVIVNSRAVMPVNAVLKGSGYDGEEMIGYLRRNVPDLTVVDCDRACASIGSSKVVNIVLLGAAIRSGALELTMDDIRRAMELKIKPQFMEMNLAALNYEDYRRD